MESGHQLREALAALGQRIHNRLDEARATLRQSGNRGTVAEVALRDALRQYLPRRFEIGHGEVIDTYGSHSRQEDVVIIDDDHPHFYGPEDPGLFLAEGVRAIGEVKALLTSTEMASAIVNSQQAKRLRTKPSPQQVRFTSPSDALRFHDRHPFFLFCFDSQLSLQTIAARLDAASHKSDDPNGLVDAVFVLGRGVAVNLGDGNGAYAILKDSGEHYSGVVTMETDALTELVIWLSIVMPNTQRMTPLLPPYLVRSI